jgi:hypothetical protein
MEYLEKNVDWLTDKLARVTDCYLLFDCPGQVELYSHHESMKRILEALQKKNHRVCIFAWTKMLSEFTLLQQLTMSTQPVYQSSLLQCIWWTVTIALHHQITSLLCFYRYP